MANDLHMVQLWLRTKHLVELGKALRLPLRTVDTGYLAHCALGETFGENAPSVFSVEGTDGADVRVLAYSEVGSEQLQEIAKGFASPLAYRLVDWERFHSKPMPQEFPEGLRLAYEVQVCPVVRLAKPAQNHKKGAEVDAFLSECWKRPDESIERAEVYFDWLQRRFSESPFKILTTELERFQLSKLLRRNHANPRKSSLTTKPDVVIKGVVEVEDSEFVHEFLARGLGRHRAFGFGMLKLKRLDA